VATVWDEWFERAGTTEDDIEQVVSALVARL
jgi:hypothetical protein